MPLATFAPEIAPSPGTNIQPNIKLLKTEFGDGYSQAAPAGLNHIRRTLSLKWEALTEAQKSYIDEFLIAQGGYKTFYYQPIGYSAQVKWTCEEWSVTAGAPWSITAKFVESFYVGS